MWFLLLLLLKAFLEWLIWFAPGQGNRGMTDSEKNTTGKVMGYAQEISSWGTTCGCEPIKPERKK